MISKDKQYRTRDGREVRIYATDGTSRPVHGAIKYPKDWRAETWLLDGSWIYDEEHTLDLIEVRPRIKRTVWLNVYPDGCQTVLPSKEQADKFRISDRLACVRVEIDCEEGEGL